MDEQGKKLIELITKCENEILKAHPHITDTARIVATAEYLLTYGVIAPPCKVGDVVYFVCLDENCEKFIDKGKVYAISQNENTLWFSVRYLSGLRYDHTADDFGKTVFLSCEEAGKVLKEREDNSKL